MPIIRRLLMKGRGCRIAYLLGGPIVNLIVLLSTLVAFVQFGPAGYMVIVMRMVSFGRLPGRTTATCRSSSSRTHPEST